MRDWSSGRASAFQAEETSSILVSRSKFGDAMSKWLKEVKEAIVKDGFSVLKVETHKHYKVFLEKEGTRFFVFVSKSPSDTIRGMLRVIQSVREQFRETKEKRLTAVQV